MADLKYSRQREAILTVLKSRHDHPTADAIYKALQNDYPHLSLGTVYRNLNLLADLGTICRVRCEEGTERYDYNTTEHYHFVCRRCGSIQDLPMDAVPDLNRRAENTGVGTVEHHSLIFYGCCRSCREKELSESGS